MVYYPKSNFRHVGFVKSNTKYKKYDAIVRNKKDDSSFRVPFGDNRYEHYKDKTGLGLYSNSPGYFSMKYLWS